MVPNPDGVDDLDGQKWIPERESRLRGAISYRVVWGISRRRIGLYTAQLRQAKHQKNWEEGRHFSVESLACFIDQNRAIAAPESTPRGDRRCTLPGWLVGGPWMDIAADWAEEERCTAACEHCARCSVNGWIGTHVGIEMICFFTHSVGTETVVNFPGA